MNRWAVGGLGMAALAAVSCGGDPGDSAEYDGGRSRAVDIAPLLSRAGHTSNDDLLTAGLGERELSCEGDAWSVRVRFEPGGPPPIERLFVVTWDMPAGTLANAWELAREADVEHWSLKLSAEVAGFGCEERYATSFFLLAAWGDKVSRPLGFTRALPGVLDESIFDGNPGVIAYTSFIDIRETDLPEPDTATFYLKNLFTGAVASADVAVSLDEYGGGANLDVDFTKLGLGAAADVAVGALIKREGKEMMSHCFTFRDDRVP
jgi:hypothetical protein